MLQTSQWFYFFLTHGYPGSWVFVGSAPSIVPTGASDALFMAFYQPAQYNRAVRGLYSVDQNRYERWETLAKQY